VRALDGGQDPEHQRLLRCLRDAADALEELEPELAGSGGALRSAAESIEASSVDSLDHADQLLTALVATRDRLRARAEPAKRAPALGAALAQVGRALDDLSARRPLLEQEHAVRSAFRALADALFLASNQDAPFGSRAPRQRSVEDVMAQARDDVLALGRADLDNIRELTSRAMYSIADLVEVSAGPGQTSSAVVEIRAEAKRLQHESSTLFARTGWVERGLESALSALDGLEVCRKALVQLWAQAARRATQALPKGGALPFQHAAMQDAFRATLDAFGVALVDRGSCHPSERRTPRAALEAKEPAQGH
jgi:hypothetical protein